MKLCKITTYTLLVVLVVMIVMQQSSARRRRRNNLIRRRDFGGVSRFRGCSSRVVDTYRFMCQMEMWGSDVCNRGNRLFCSRKAYSSHPACRHNCTKLRKKNLTAEFSDGGVRLRKRRGLNGKNERKSEATLQYYYNRSKKRSDLFPKSDTQRIQRHSLLYDCCRRSCSTRLLKRICRASN